MIHTPVLVRETLRFWHTRPGGHYIDATVGTGGHCEKLLETDPEAKCLGIDRDPQALETARKRLERFENRIMLIHENYKNLLPLMSQIRWPASDGILLDLGVSSLQLEDPQRGFSFRTAGPLDMRMNPAQEETAQQLIRRLSQEQLAKILKEFGEERQSRRIAEAIKRRDKIHPIEDTAALAEVVSNAVHSVRKSSKRRAPLHPATKTFQALRIALNHELDNLEQLLPQIPRILAAGGNAVLISFHSLEDRRVKNFFLSESRGCRCPNDFPKCVCGRKPTLKILTKKPLVPKEEEVQENPRARSAKLRAAEKW